MDAPHSPAPAIDRLEQQLRFLAEIDKLKNVLRRGLVTDTLRPENSAEHSWHLAMLVLMLGEHAAPPQPDLLHAVKLVLIHDLVEIDAGDTFYYDAEGNATKAAREQQAADRIFRILPDDQARELRALWDEFEAGITPEAKLAQALDRLQAVLQNLNTGCSAWKKHGVTKAQIFERNQKIGIVLPGIWKEVRLRIDQAEEQGHFK